MKLIKLYLNYAGFCFANEKHALQKGTNKKISFKALFGLILHPEKGWILFDTGYSKRFYEVTKNYPNKIYAKATTVFIKSEYEVHAQLKRLDINPSDIKHIIISHFHADHIGGLKDFENAKFYCSNAAYTTLKNTSNFWGFTSGFLKDLLPLNFDENVIFIENFATQIPDETFGKKYDLWGDESIFVYDLPGHAAGQIGILLQTHKQKYFLISDACWLKKSYEELVFAHPIVSLFFDSWNDYKATLNKIHTFHKSFPEVLIVPTHCGKTSEKLINEPFNIDVL